MSSSEEEACIKTKCGPKKIHVQMDLLSLDTSGNLFSVSNDFDIIHHDPKRKQIVGRNNLSNEI